MRHIADQANWIRDYSYAEDNNRLLSTSDNTGSFRPLELQYGYDDAHGYMTQLPHLSEMDYNFKDELIATSRQQVNEQVNEDLESNVERTQEYVVYQYDASGMRTRKVCYGQNGNIKYERRYLGSTEEYYQDSGQYAGLVRHSLHINDGEQRVALYEQRNDIDDDSPVQTMRYQIANHQPSSTLELDDEANLISYEIYHPFGTTAYQANNKDIKAAAKRYRYSGKERDEETGLYYFGARYYMPWLGRWTSCDPIVFSEGQYAEAELNGYQYVDNDPVGGVDPSGENRSLADRNRLREIQGQQALKKPQTRMDMFRESGASMEAREIESLVNFKSYLNSKADDIRDSAEKKFGRPYEPIQSVGGGIKDTGILPVSNNAAGHDLAEASASIVDLAAEFVPTTDVGVAVEVGTLGTAGVGKAVNLIKNFAKKFKKGDNAKRSANADVDSEFRVNDADDFRAQTPRGLSGHDFETYLHRNLPEGKPVGQREALIGGNKKSRDFDGSYVKDGQEIWYEAKTGRALEDPAQVAKFRSNLGEQQQIAEAFGVKFEVHSNSPIPQDIKDWLTARNVQYVEHL